MAELKFYNTLSKKLEVFKPLSPERVTIYYCGPTVYWTQHIGNLRGGFCADSIYRVLRYFGYRAVMARNYTDVGHLSSDGDAGEDKIEKGAKREGLDPEAIANKYIKIYEADTAALNFLEPDYKPRATAHIPEMIAMVKTLLDKGFAYATPLAIYFSVAKFPDYTALSGQKLDENLSGAGRGEVSDPDKRASADFALWFFKAGTHANAIQTWVSPFISPLVADGRGFPGWHIECSAMSKRYLGDTLDLHLGGIEHIPVHHTNEIAQSESANGVKFVDYWLHNEHLLINNEKMSKSQGTAYSLDEIRTKGFSPLALRFLFLGAHYRSRQNFTWEALASSQKALDGLRARLGVLEKDGGSVDKSAKERFLEALAEDANLPRALAVAYETLKDENIVGRDRSATLLDFDKVLGLDLDKSWEKSAILDLPVEIEELFKKREIARSNKDFTEADRLRQEIEKRGYIIQDGSGKTAIKPV
jgi:cysteinyl-tRNA synthetase